MPSKTLTAQTVQVLKPRSWRIDDFDATTREDVVLHVPRERKATSALDHRTVSGLRT